MTILRFAFRSLCIGALAVSVAACGKTKTYSSIEPGLDNQRPRSSLEIPPNLVETSSDELLASQASVSSRDTEVLPETEKLNVQRNDAEGWVEVEAPVETVWRKLEAYWGSLGVGLVVSDPKTGVMETDWVKPAGSEDERNQGLTDRLIGQFMGTLLGGPTSLDKYTLELERQGEQRTRIYVSHRGRKKVQTQKGNIAHVAKYEWVETEEDPKKVKRAMSSIIYRLDASSDSS